MRGLAVKGDGVGLRECYRKNDMRWYLKSAGFKVLSTVPGGTALYSFAQQNITHSTDATVARVDQKINVGLDYWKWLKAHGHADRILAGTILDFGAGWHPTIPLLNYALGVPRQALLDLSPLITARQIVKTARIFRERVSAPEWPAGAELQRLPEVPPDINAGVSTLLGRWGMTYYTPYAPKSGALRDAADAVFCTQVLLHLPREPLRQCFRMLRECLQPGGLILGTVHLMDLYSHTDPGITPYHHLKFSPEFWERWVNTPMMPFNRFKARDYRELLLETGFKLLHEEVNQPSATDYASLDTVKLDPYFSTYTRDELAAKHLFFVAQKS